tara:strand:- start:608 stop:865 length:258 start_codon:yes stop_codon:yes gene_type:complete
MDQDRINTAIKYYGQGEIHTDFSDVMQLPAASMQHDDIPTEGTRSLDIYSNKSGAKLISICIGPKGFAVVNYSEDFNKIVIRDEE